MLDYARFHGLTVNHQAKCPIQQCIEDLECIESDEESVIVGTEDLGAQLRHERILVTKDALALLSEVTKAQDQELHDAFLLPKTRWSHDLKVELPLLRTDPEVDMQDHPHLVILGLGKEFLPLDQVEDEEDESLEWLGLSHSSPSKVNAKLPSEKLTISKDAILYLQEVSGHCEIDCEAYKLQSKLESDGLVQLLAHTTT